MKMGLYSRCRNTTKYQFSKKSLNQENVSEKNENNRVTGYYCSCQSGARTPGSCGHLISNL